MNNENPVWLLLGNPNSGKTTFFNALTRQNDKTANFPGSTNSIKQGTFFSLHGEKHIILDTPGTYTLTGITNTDNIIRDLVLGRNKEFPIISGIICVVDASNLQHNLYLVSQILEFDIPVIMVLSMIDVAHQRCITINEHRLKALLKCDVVTYSRKNASSLIKIKSIICSVKNNQNRNQIHFDPEIEKTILLVPSKSRGASITLLFLEDFKEKEVIEELYSKLPEWKSSIICSRYKYLDQFKINNSLPTRSEIVDNVLLHPILGWFPLIGFLCLLLWSIFVFAPVPMGWIHLAFSKLAFAIHNHISNPWICDLISKGIIPGVGNVIAYLPQIAVLFFFIELFESIGYLPRVSFFFDHMMRRFGLPGCFFIPLLSSYACSIPGILSTRSLASKQERVTAMLIIPLMSCSGRLPVYMLLLNMMLPKYPLFKSLFLVMIYLITTICALALALILRKIFFKGNESSSMMELPSFRRPLFINIFKDLYYKMKYFLWRAGTVILFFSIILWFLMNFPCSYYDNKTSNINDSYAAKIGHFIEPAIKPLGYDWKIGVAILSSFAARETFVSTLSIVQNKENHSYDSNLSVKKYPFRVCLGLLFLFAFSFQCIGTIVVLWKETASFRYPLYQFFYMNGFAYIVALFINQIGLCL